MSLLRGFLVQLQVTFRGFATVAMPTNCVLSAKIKVFREERRTIQEKTSNSAKPLLVLRRVWKLYFVNLFGFSFNFYFVLFNCDFSKKEFRNTFQIQQFNATLFTPTFSVSICHFLFLNAKIFGKKFSNSTIQRNTFHANFFQ